MCSQTSVGRRYQEDFASPPETVACQLSLIGETWEFWKMDLSFTYFLSHLLQAIYLYSLIKICLFDD
jgi:hypothetical protein